MDMAGRKGGTCRPPRFALPAETVAQIIKDTEAVLGKGYK